MSRGSLPLKVRLPGCAPIRRASGVHDRKMRDKLVRMLHVLYEQGRTDLVNGIASGRLHPMQVYGAFRVTRLEDLPTADELPRLRDTWPAWLEQMDCSDDHRLSMRLYFKRLSAMLPPDATAGQIVDALKAYREQVRAHPRTFNLAKSHVQAFLRDTLGKRHRCYLDAKDIPHLRITLRRLRHPLTPEQLKQVVHELGQPFGGMAWTMATTGMGWKEYIGPWRLEGEGLRIHGTKARGRDRLVPVVGPLYQQGCGLLTYRRRLRVHKLTPYDMRRTYAGLMVEAGIPRPRRIAYMGHVATDVTAVYEAQEVREFLIKDADRLRNALGWAAFGPTLQLVEHA